MLLNTAGILSSLQLQCAGSNEKYNRARYNYTTIDWRQKRSLSCQAHQVIYLRKCHPAMPSMMEVRSDKTLLVSQSRTTMGTRRPSVFAANIYNQHLGFSSDSDETDN